jgi:hypothetical protein
MIKHVCWQIIRQIEDSVIVVNIDAADKFRFDIRFVCNRTNDITGLHTMLMANRDTVGLHARFGNARAMFATCRVLRAHHDHVKDAHRDRCGQGVHRASCHRF